MKSTKKIFIKWALANIVLTERIGEDEALSWLAGLPDFWTRPKFEKKMYFNHLNFTLVKMQQQNNREMTYCQVKTMCAQSWYGWYTEHRYTGIRYKFLLNNTLQCISNVCIIWRALVSVRRMFQMVPNFTVKDIPLIPKKKKKLD